MLLPPSSAEEASLLKGIDVYSIGSLTEAVAFSKARCFSKAKAMTFKSVCLLLFKYSLRKLVSSRQLGHHVPKI